MADFGNSESIKLEKFFDTDRISELKNVINKIFDSKYFRGSGGEYMRPAVCFFIKKLAISKLFQQPENKLDESFIKEWEQFLTECVEYNKESIQLAAVQTLPFYCEFKFPKVKPNKDGDVTRFIDRYLHNLKSTSKEYVRSGYCLALGHIPFYLLNSNEIFRSIVEVLILSSQTISGPISEGEKSTLPIVVNKTKYATIDTAGWVQARKDSINALSKLLKLIRTRNDLTNLNLDIQSTLSVFDCFLVGLADYSIDSKGDSGSKVREASIKALEEFLLLCAQLKLDELTSNEALIKNILGGIMQQAVERIDRTRNIACRAFVNILHSKELKLESFDFVKLLHKVFTKQVCKSIDWNVAHVTFPLFVSLLSVKEFQRHLLTGLVFSIGSLTESLVKAAVSSFLKELQAMKADETKQLMFVEIIEHILELCKSHLKNDRLATSLIKSVDLMVQNDLLNSKLISDKHIPVEFMNTFLANVKVTRDMQKLTSYVDLFCDMLQFDEERIRERAMIQLMIMLCHQYPLVRKAAATKLFEALINYTELIFDNDDEANEECVQLLTETNWDQPVDKIRPIRNRICDLTKTPKPVLTKPQTAS